MIKFIKKYLYNKELDKKIKYIEKFITGRCSHKVIDPDLDEKEKDIERQLKEKLKNNKISYEKYASVMNGLYYHRNINNNLEKELLKSFAKDLESKEPNVEETQNAICEAIERSDKNVR